MKYSIENVCYGDEFQSSSGNWCQVIDKHDSFVVLSGFGTCSYDGLETIFKSRRNTAEIAALRKRLGDMWLGVQSGATSGLDEMMGLVYCVGKAWPQCKETGIPKEGIYNLDTLAAWLWERGCRA